MANDTTLTIIGNLTADPELRFTPSGAAVANFTVAATPRAFDKNANEWKDGETIFMRCTAWRDLAEQVAESLTRGTRVIVTGRLRSQSWEDKDTGQKRTALQLDVDEIGPSLRYATAKVTKVQRGQQQGGGFAQQPPQQQYTPTQQQAPQYPPQQPPQYAPPQQGQPVQQGLPGTPPTPPQQQGWAAQQAPYGEPPF